MGGRTSLNKGKRGEREVIALLQPLVDKVYAEFEGLVDARTGIVLGSVRLQRNTLQSDAGGFDIVGLEWLALEVKFHEDTSDGKRNQWWRQTCGQAGPGQEPVLIWRKSRVDWKIRMYGVLPAGTKRIRTTIETDLASWLLWFEWRLRWELKKRVTV